jgi:methionyl-tRNA formyltransferase
LHDRLAQLGANTLVNMLDELTEKQKTAEIQDDSLTCYAEKLQKQEAQIDWSQPAEQLLRQINAFNPWPVAQTQWNDQVMRIWQAEIIADNSEQNAGSIHAVSKQGIDVSTGQGILLIKQLQIPGKKAMTVQDFLNSQTIDVGDTLG